MARPRPHVCFVAPNAFPLLSGNEELPVIGGAELQVVIVARLLAARNRRVSMVCLDYGQDEVTVVDGITVFKAYRPSAGLPVLRFLHPRLTALWQAMARANADIYYQQTAGAVTGIMTAFSRRHRKKAVFAAASNPDLFRSTPRIKYARDRWLYTYGLRRADEIFVQNDEQMYLCRTNFGRGSILVRNCYSPPSDLQPRGRRNHILWVSTIRRLKQPHLFLDLAQALPHDEFVMAGGPGDGEHPLYEEVRQRAADIDNVEFVGFLPFRETEVLFNGALLFVNTSESEGFPNTFLQAWARAIPTVSFVDAGARLNGAPVGETVHSFQELVARTERLARDANARIEIGRQSASYVAKFHSPEQIIAQYESIFDSLIDCDARTVSGNDCSVSEDASSEADR